MKPIQDLKNELREKLPLGIDIAISALKSNIPTDLQKYNDIILLEGRYRELHQNMLRGVMNDDEVQVEFNKLREDILNFINSLEEKDFVKQTPTQQAQAKKGKVLYRIPNRMQVQKEAKCLVRIAFNEEILMQNLEKSADDAIKDVRIAEVMGVELIDPNEQPAFAIRTFSEKVQLIDEMDVTEWLFFVKPLQEGNFPLLLKVAVVEIVDGLERKREVVLEETVQVVASEVTDEEKPMADSGVALQMAGSAGGTTTKPVIGNETIKKASKAGVALIGLGVAMAIWAFLTFYNQSKQPDIASGGGGARKEWDQLKNSEDSTLLKDFLKNFPDSEFENMAESRLKSLRLDVDAQQQGDSIILQTSDGVFPMQLALLTAAGEEIISQTYYDAAYIAIDGKAAGLATGTYQVRMTDANGISRVVTVQYVSSQDVENQIVVDTVKTKPNPKPTPSKPANKPKSANKPKPVPQKTDTVTTDSKKTTQPASEITYSFNNVSRAPIYASCNTRRLQQAQEATQLAKELDKARNCTSREISDYIKSKLSRTSEVISNNSEKLVQVVFLIGKDGKVKVENIQQDFDINFKEKVKQVVESLPTFIPGQDALGKKVAVRYILPIRFKPAN